MSDFDHGVLNVPLAKRGDIDLQIDRYLAEKEALDTAQHKAFRKHFRESVATAKSMVESLTTERLAELGKPHGLTAKKTKAQLLSIAAMRPETAIAALSRESA